MIDDDLSEEGDGWIVPLEFSDQLHFDNEWDFNYEYYRNQFVKSSKFGLGLIGIFDEHIDITCSDNVFSYYLLHYTIEPREILKNEFYIFQYMMDDHQISQFHRVKYNPFIRNCHNINIKKPQIEIIQRIYYKGYSLAIKKTFWLKLIQRKFKNRYRKKISFMRNINNLNYREIHGKWPREFYHI